MGARPGFEVGLSWQLRQAFDAMTSAWIDVSVTIRPGMVLWPGDPAVRIERVQDLSRGDEANVTRLEMSAHTGTHIDAPLHYLADGASLDAMPLEATVGPARVIAIEHPREILPVELEAFDLRPGERVLFRTRNSGRSREHGPAPGDLVHLSPAAARLLADRKVRTVGIDGLSVGNAGEEGAEVHRIILGAAIWLIEGLDLAAAEPGAYDLVCLPLRLAGADGAPARAILRRRP